MLIEADRDPAEEHPPSAVWHVDVKGLSAIAAWSQKRPGLGEDAEPTFLHHLPSRRGVLGVYDGLGGAGARHAGRVRDGRQISHAFVAARLAYLTVQSWFSARVTNGDTGPSLSERLAEVLAGARSAARNKLVGTLRRDFPTTLALIEYQESRQGVTVTASWAGDSRCYLLTAECGLQQLSRDDSDVQDVLELLIADQPMTNVVSASGDFVIHRRKFTPFSLPCMLVCATDGFFGYVAAPALFEHVLLGELTRSDDEGQWARNLAARVRTYTADDASLVVVALGFGSFKKMRERFARRLQKLDAEHAEVLGAVDNRAAFVAARRHSWERYRRQYLRYIDWPTFLSTDGSAADFGPPLETRQLGVAADGGKDASR